ncbi:MAG: hypothetical protein DRI75_04630 [Bacteroidetes bacterium]|nr:MAG: hypothetical protein DRI75_04630 [Bacteroidota bacterium]
MKNIIKFLLSLAIVVSFNSCSDSSNTIDDVFDYEVGAVLRTLEVISNTLNSSDPSSFWSVSVEEQDGEDGALLASVGVFVSIRDLTPANGTTVAADMFVKTIDASEFSTNTPHGLPRVTIAVTFAEAEAAMGLTSADHSPGDLFVFELRLELTDGRIYGADSAASIITGGFFSSPFAYNALILCSPQAGTYQVDMQDLYGDGWQGSEVVANIDGVPNAVSIDSYWDGPIGNVGDPLWSAKTDFITIPNGTVETTWEYVAGDWPSEVVFQIYAPNGDLLGDFGPSPSPGLLPVTLCAN